MLILLPSSKFPFFPEVGGWEDQAVPRVLFGVNGRFAPTSLKEPIVAEVQSMVSPVISPPAGGWVLGFMAITSEQGYLGALLVTNSWGRPLEFRLTTAINPSRVQQILYGQTLESHIVAELIGRALLEKSAVVPHIVLVDHPLGLDLQSVLEIPVVFAGRREGDGSGLYPLSNLPEGTPRLFLKQQDSPMEARIQSIIDGLPSKSDLLDPFVRAQEAMIEARKLGARAA
jgi:hypothetical protein